MKHIKRVSQAPTQLVLPILKNLGVSQEKQKKKSSRLFNKKITKTFKKKKSRGTKFGPVWSRLVCQLVDIFFNLGGDSFICEKMQF